jgi:hypothetical protein
MSRWLQALLVVVTVASAGCERDPLAIGTTPSAAQVDIRLRLRPSCGFDTAQYNTECLQALLLIVHAQYGESERRTCEILESPPENIQRLVFAGAPQIFTGALTSDGEVWFELIGLHDKNPDLADAGPQALCDDYDNFDNQLFFGRSPPLDLGDLQNADAGSVLWEIPIDCRDCEMGCTQLGQPTCPTNPISFCVPGTASLTCERPCQDNQNCFEGAMTCVDERCDQDTVPYTGAFCAECVSDDDCDPTGTLDPELNGVQTFCVGLPGENIGLCAPRCPANFCPNGSRCNRLGNRLRRIGAEASQTTDGGT